MFDSQNIYLSIKGADLFILFVYHVQISQTMVFPTMHTIPLENPNE
jgi:hypothetical protein